MSVINRMLQELDRRQGLAVDGAVPAPEVRAVAAPITREREWFWRLVAILMVGALCWVGWVAWQLQPRELVTEKAILAAEDSRRGSAAAVADAEAAKEQAENDAKAARDEARAAQAVEPVRPATASAPPVSREASRTVPNPPVAAARQAAAPASPTPAPLPRKPAATAAESVPATAQEGKLGLDVPPARIIAPPTPQSGRVVKQARLQTTAEKAEAEFRRAVALLGQGRGADAEDSLAAAIAIDPAHEAARQALVALRLESRRVDDARRLLQEGLAINPANVPFATVLARILAERRDYAAALEAMQGAAGVAAAGNADYQVLRATILQRMKRHAEAIEAYQATLRIQGLNAQAWIGLGISLEAIGKRAEAAQSFRHALEVGTLSEDLRAFAEQRERALR